MKKNKLFITALFLIIGIKAFAQIDTLNVYLEKSKEHRFGVDLVFENNSNDTIVLFTRFDNFIHSVIIPRHPGICINFFRNDRGFIFRPGDIPLSPFVFSRGVTLLYPQSNVKLFFDIGEVYSFRESFSDKIEVSFFMNYHFSKLGDSYPIEEVVYFETNRVTVVEPNEESEIQRE